MLTKSPVRILVLACAIGTLAACGGGGVSSTPAPIAVPPPPPPPPPPGPPPDPEGPIGLVSAEPFAVLGVVNDYAPDAAGNIRVEAHEPADISLEYRVSDRTYIITLPDYRPGLMSTNGYIGSFRDGRAWLDVSATYNALLDGQSGRQDAVIILSWPEGPLSRDGTLTYTGWGRWDDDPTINGRATAGNFGYFAYGIPTAQTDVPTTGTATYRAEVIGNTDNNLAPDGIYVDDVTGSALLQFDFGAGTLAGEMNAEVCPWDCYSVGTYNFIQTLYSTGSQTFSGQFARDGNVLPSWFEGSFNGPQAAELMARFRAPYTYTYNDGTNYSGIMGGIWIGRQTGRQN